MVISSRNTGRLEAAAQEMRRKLPPSSPASITPLQCNIRNENEVRFSKVFLQTISLCQHLLTQLHHALIPSCLQGEGTGVVSVEAVRQDRLLGE